MICARYTGLTHFLLLMLKEADKDIEEFRIDVIHRVSLEETGFTDNHVSSNSRNGQSGTICGAQALMTVEWYLKTGSCICSISGNLDGDCCREF